MTKVIEERLIPYIIIIAIFTGPAGAVVGTILGATVFRAKEFTDMMGLTLAATVLATVALGCLLTKVTMDTEPP